MPGYYLLDPGGAADPGSGKLIYRITGVEPAGKERITFWIEAFVFDPVNHRIEEDASSSTWRDYQIPESANPVDFTKGALGNNPVDFNEIIDLLARDTGRDEGRLADTYGYSELAEFSVMLQEFGELVKHNFYTPAFVKEYMETADFTIDDQNPKMAWCSFTATRNVPWIPPTGDETAFIAPSLSPVSLQGGAFTVDSTGLYNALRNIYSDFTYEDVLASAESYGFTVEFPSNYAPMLAYKHNRDIREGFQGELSRQEYWSIDSVCIPWAFITNTENYDATVQQKVREEYAALLEKAKRGELELGAGLTSGQKRCKLPLSEQAILLYQLDTLVRSNKIRRLDPEVSPEEAYDRFATLDTEDESGKQIQDLANSLTSPPSMRALFDDIKPIHLSSIIPRVRLFKIYTPDHSRAQDTPEAEEESRVLMEYEFEEHIKENFLAATLTTNTGVGLESFQWDFNGTNQFEAEKMVEANLKLRAQSVDALNILRKSSTNPEHKYKFLDLFIPEVEKDGKPIKTADNAIFQKKDVRMYETRLLVEYGVPKNSQVFSGPTGSPNAKVLAALESLQLVMNLNITSYDIELKDDGSVGINVRFVGRLEAAAEDPNFGNILPQAKVNKALEIQKKNLIAERTNALDMGETSADGTVIREPNPGSVGDLTTQREKTLHKIANMRAGTSDELTAEQLEEIKAYEEEVKIINQGLAEINAKYSSSQKEFLKKSSDQLSRLSLYRGIYKGLLKRKALRVLTVDPNNVAPNPLDSNFSARCPEVPSNAGVIAQAVASIASERVEDPETYQSTERIESELLDFQKNLEKTIQPLYSPSEYRIHYIYFGDLVDTVLDNMYTNRVDESDLRCILGPIRIGRNLFSSDSFETNIKISRSGCLQVGSKYNSGFDFQKKAQMEEAIRTGREIEQQNTPTPPPGADAVPPILKPKIPGDFTVVNLADVPISFNLFLQWFAEKVSNKGVYSYTLKKFLMDAIQSLIVSALEADSTMLLLPKQKRKMMCLTWDAPTHKGARDALGFGHYAPSDHTQGLNFKLPTDSVTKKRRLLKIEDLRRTIDGAPPQLPMTRKSMSGTEPFSDYIMLYVEPDSYGRKYRPGRLWISDGAQTEYDRDMQDGIYHLESGRETGIVKDIKLSVVTAEFYEEMKQQEAQKTGKRPVKRIYQATVSMYGVTFFRPGQTVYINAAAYGSHDLLKRFGLCGYYTIRTTSCQFAAGSFETQLICDFRSEG